MALSRRSCRSQKQFSFYLRCTLEASVQDASRVTAAAASHVSRGVNYTRSLCHPNPVGFLCNASAVRCENVISSAVNQSSSVNRKSGPCFVGKKTKNSCIMSFAVGYVTNSEQMRFLYPPSVATVFEKNNIICGCSATREKAKSTLSKTRRRFDVHHSDRATTKSRRASIMFSAGKLCRNV